MSTVSIEADQVNIYTAIYHDRGSEEEEHWAIHIDDTYSGQSIHQFHNHPENGHRRVASIEYDSNSQSDPLWETSTPIGSIESAWVPVVREFVQGYVGVSGVR